MRGIQQEAKEGLRHIPSRWPALILACALITVTVNLLLQHKLPVFFQTDVYSPALTVDSNDDSLGQWRDPDGDEGQWFDEMSEALDMMQGAYWNGTTWPSTIQWISAVLDTLLASSDRTITRTLGDYWSDELAVVAPRPFVTSSIEGYFAQMRAFYGAEDVIQIFDAAYDDAQWVVLEALEVIRFIRLYDEYAKSTLGQSDIASFAHRAHIFYNIVQDHFETSLCGGGITWNPSLAPYKNAITNELLLSSSMAMYLYYPGDNNSDPYPSAGYVNATNTTLPPLPPLAAHDPVLLSNAVREYEWFKTHNFTNAQGLIVDGFHVSPNQTSCDERNEMVYTYNQGVLLSGLRGLWEATGNTSYLDDGYALVETVVNATGWYNRNSSLAGKWAGLGRNGTMEDYCDATARCTQDSQAFKGIYFHHLDLFCERLPTEKPLVPGLTELADAHLASEHERKCGSYVEWVEHNAGAALSTRNSSGLIGGWWGASWVNQTQNLSYADAVMPPSDNADVWNEPWILQQPPWVCNGQHGCGESGRGSQMARKRKARFFEQRTSDFNDRGRGRTVETEASGISILKAANNLVLREKAR